MPSPVSLLDLPPLTAGVASFMMLHVVKQLRRQPFASVHSGLPTRLSQFGLMQKATIHSINKYQQQCIMVSCSDRPRHLCAATVPSEAVHIAAKITEAEDNAETEKIEGYQRKR